jgi:hypothetical protein
MTGFQMVSGALTAGVLTTGAQMAAGRKDSP